MDYFKKVQTENIGPGGFKCPCCNSFFGKERKVINRRARRVMKNRLNVKLSYLD